MEHSCHGLCGATHRGILGICTGVATTTREFWGQTARDLGLPPKDIPMCEPCAYASDAAPTSARTAPTS